jgi:hypothetical protein
MQRDVPKTSHKSPIENVETREEPFARQQVPQPDGFGKSKADQLGQAMAVATEAGQEIARRFASLNRRQRLTLARVFRRQLLPPGKPGRRRSKEIDSAFADWKAGMRGVDLYRKHIPRFVGMGYWKRKVKTRALLEAIRSRDRRERNRNALAEL